MKLRIILLLCFGSFCILSSWSCSKDDVDDSDVSSTQCFKIYGQRFSMTSAALWKCGVNMMISVKPYVYIDSYIDQGGNQVNDPINGFESDDNFSETGVFMLSLYEKGFRFDNQLQAAVGSGAVICLHLASQGKDNLTMGQYTYATDKSEMTFVGYSDVGYTFPKTSITGDLRTPAEITKGGIDISKSGDIYTLRFSGETSIGALSEATYIGEVNSFDISDKVMGRITDESLAGLMDSIKTVDVTITNGVERRVTTYSLDKTSGKAFVNLSKSEITNAEASDKKRADIAAKYIEQSNSIQLTSPIEMRSYLGHVSKYNMTTHTKYMFAPSSFDEKDFDNFTAEAFDFTVTPQSVIIPLAGFGRPLFVFFETGTGMRGIMKIKGVAGKTSKTTIISAGGNYRITDVNPTLIVDIKYPKPINMRIR